MKKGVTLYLTILILVALTTMTVALSQLIVIPMRTTQELVFVVQALHAADSGVEKALYRIYRVMGGVAPTTTLTFQDSFSNGASSTAIVYPAGTSPCPSPPNINWYCIFSTGHFRGVERRLEASY